MVSALWSTLLRGRPNWPMEVSAALALVALFGVACGGAIGEQGPAGPRGETGPTGAPGPNGAAAIQQRR